MNRLILSFLLMWTSLNLLAQPAESAEGIKFFHGTLEELKKEAKDQKKVIFLDAFTEWCGPCKMMSATTFVDKSVGEFFNKNFINYKLDMEKGEGPGFAVRYGVNAYPTLLFINAQGEVLHKILGFRNADMLINEAKTALNPKDNLSLMQQAFEEGTQDPELLFLYAVRLRDMEMDNSAVVARYFERVAEKDLISDANWKAIKELTENPDSREFQYLLKKKADFAKKHGEAAVEQKIQQVCTVAALNAIAAKDAATFQKAADIARKHLADKGKTADELELKQLAFNGEWDAYAPKCVAYVGKFKPTNEQWLNEAAWNFYEHIADKALLEKALGWAKQSVALDNAFYNNDTVAALYYKLGKYEDALRYANKAINLANEKGEDAGETEKLLEKIREKMGSN